MSRPILRLFDGYPHTSPALQEAVRELQMMLLKHHYAVETDGFFGTATELSLKQFQADNQLAADGIAGAQTWAKLLGATVSENSEVFDTTFPLEDLALTAQLAEARKYADVIQSGAKRANIPACLIYGIGSRESHWGLLLTPRGPEGTGDTIKRPAPTPFRSGALPPDGRGFGRGLMQIDFDAHAFARSEEWRNPGKNIHYACGVLRDALTLLSRKTQLKDRDLLRSAVAAYNCGAGRVLQALTSNRDVDYFTFGRNYSHDVLNRAGWFQLHEWK